MQAVCFDFVPFFRRIHVTKAPVACFLFGGGRPPAPPLITQQCYVCPSWHETHVLGQINDTSGSK